MRSHIKTLALTGAAYFTTAGAGFTGPVNDAEAVVRLLDLFSTRTDTLAVANMAKRLAAGATPAEAIGSDPHAPFSEPEVWNTADNTRSLARQLGEHVMRHPDKFAGPLPDPSVIGEPLRLEAFFVGLHQKVLGQALSGGSGQKDLARLSSLLDDAWLRAATDCGATDIRQLILTHRGELRKLVLSYQESEDETSLISLGETLASYSVAYKQLSPGEFRPRTLALLMAGSLGERHPAPAENLAIVMTAARWTREHAGMMDMLRDLRDPPSLALLQAAVLWQENREAAMKHLGAIHWISPHTRAGFAMECFRDASLSEPDAAALVRLLPTDMLEAWPKGSQSGNPRNNPTQTSEWILMELHSRKDRRKETR